MALRIETALNTRLAHDGRGRQGGFRRDDEIDLTSPRVQRQICAAGFAPSEFDGSWIEQPTAQLLIQLADCGPDPVAIWLVVLPFVTHRHAQLVDPACDGVPFERIRFGGEQPGWHLVKIVRPAAFLGDPWLRIAFSFGSRSSPEQEGLSDDPRPLGLKILRLAVTAVDAPPPPFEGYVRLIEAVPMPPPETDLAPAGHDAPRAEGVAG